MLESKDVFALSDEQLLQMLKKYKGPVGPIMDGTRILYQRKLCRILDDLKCSESSDTMPGESDPSTFNDDTGKGDSMEIHIKVYPEQNDEGSALPAESSKLTMSISGANEVHYGKCQEFEDISAIENSNSSQLTFKIYPDTPETQAFPSKPLISQESPRQSTPRNQSNFQGLGEDTIGNKTRKEGLSRSTQQQQQNLRHRSRLAGNFLHSSPIDATPKANSLSDSPELTAYSLGVNNQDKSSVRRPFDSRIEKIMNRTLISPPWLDSYSRSFSGNSSLGESFSDFPPRTVSTKSPASLHFVNNLTLQNPYVKISLVASMVAFFLFAILIYVNMEGDTQHPFPKVVKQ